MSTDWTGNTFRKVRIFLEMIRFEHTLFALPFAYLGLFLAERRWPRGDLFLWVTVAMVSLRTAAMSLNRIVDREIDAENPRTRGWALPQRLLPLSSVGWVIAFALAIFFLAAWMLGRLCFVLSPIPVVLILVYPYLKRLTWLSHFVLGMILGMAPAGAWIASRGTITNEVWFLFFGVGVWVAGFDMIYAIQDVGFDREKRLFSVPASLGVEVAVFTAQFFHLIALIFLILLGFQADLGSFYWAGLLAVIFFLFREHWLIRAYGMSRLQEAFFQMNVAVSGAVFLAVVLDVTEIIEIF